MGPKNGVGIPPPGLADESGDRAIAQAAAPWSQEGWQTAETEALIADFRQQVTRLETVACRLQELAEVSLPQPNPSEDVGRKPSLVLQVVRPFGHGSELAVWANALYALVAVLLVTLLAVVVWGA